MKSLCALVLVALLLPAGEAAQKSVFPGAPPTKNPVSTAIKARLEEQAKNLLTAAEFMPATRYSFKPTPEMMTFGALVFHVADTNYGLCSTIAGRSFPGVMINENSPKDRLMENLARSFDYCREALAQVDDSRLDEAVQYFEEKLVSRADALISLSDDWNDHYAAQAIYLRLNGILPPTARPQLRNLANLFLP